MFSKRTEDLLLKAAKCFGDGCSPFENWWLSENDVTFDECMQLSNIISTVLKGFVLSDANIQNAIIAVSVTDGEISTGLFMKIQKESALRKKINK